MATDIFKQIESTAGTFPPGTYYNLLGFYSNMSIEPDTISADFIPLTAARQNTKLFAIGIIPPAVDITGRILDRSASFAVPDDTPKNDDQNYLVDSRRPTTSAGGNSFSSLDLQFWVNYVDMCRRTGTDPRDLAKVWYKESGFNPNALGKHGQTVVAKGLAQLTKRTGVNVAGMTPAQWDNMENLGGKEQLPIMEKFLRKSGQAGKSALSIYTRNMGGYTNSLIEGQGYMGEGTYNLLPPDIKEVIKNETGGESALQSMFAGYNANVGVDIFADGIVDVRDLAERLKDPLPPHIEAQIAAAEAAIARGAEADPVAGDAANGNWRGKGSFDAQKAYLDKLEGTQAKAAELGKKLLAAQNAMIIEAQRALQAMKRIPPLRMLVNPQKFGIKGAKIIADGSWGRVGPIIEHWGNDQDKISASGKLAGFYALQTAPPSNPAAPGHAATSENSGMPGLTRSARNFTKSWQNFQSLFLLYRNNAGMYLTDNLNTGEKTTNLAMLGSIYIYYDNILYIGSFDTLSLTENDTAPHSAEYSFEFTVRAAFTLDRTDDAFTYGAPNLFRSNGPLSAADAAKLQANPQGQPDGGGTTFPEVGGHDPANPTVTGLPAPAEGGG